MKIRVVLARRIEQYADILLDNVDTPTMARTQVERMLEASPAQRARLLSTLTWYGNVEASAIIVTETEIIDR